VTFTVTQPGRSNLAGDQRALFLRLFSGEVYEAFRNATIFKDTVLNKSISGGRSHQFIHTGRITAAYHTPGTAILGSGNPPSAETTIELDDLLIASAFVYKLDEVISQYDIRGPISRQIGQALAEHYDRRVARVLSRASGLAAPVTNEPGGFRINIGLNQEYNAQALVDGFFEAAARLDEVAAPKDGRFAVLAPRQYYALISQVDTNILNKDFGTTTQGSLNTGDGLYEIAGIKIRRSNNIPFLGRYGSPSGAVIDTDTAGGSGTYGARNTYGVAADFNNSCGLIYHRDAAAVLTGIGPSVETTGADTKVIYQGDVIVGKLALGAGPVRVSVAGEFRNVA
jgi:hypothetical protein